MPRAGFWIRALAAAIDAVAGGILLFAAAVAAYTAGSFFDLARPLADSFMNAVPFGVLLAYTSLEVWLGATPGKLALGLVIGTSAGGRADRWTLALRWSSKHFGLFLLTAWAPTQYVLLEFLAGWMNTVVMVGCLQALDEHRRAWHDEWAGTAVWRRRSPRPYERSAPAAGHAR